MLIAITKHLAYGIWLIGFIKEGLSRGKITELSPALGDITFAQLHTPWPSRNRSPEEEKLFCKRVVLLSGESQYKHTEYLHPLLRKSKYW